MDSGHCRFWLKCHWQGLVQTDCDQADFFWLYNILWKEVMCKRYLPLKRQIIPVKIIICLHFHVSGKNKTDSTVFHFLVKYNLLGKLEIPEVLGTLIYMYLNTMRLLEHECRFRRIKSSLKYDPWEISDCDELENQCFFVACALWLSLEGCWQIPRSWEVELTVTSLNLSLLRSWKCMIQLMFN